jgi:soluble lytic murein transglycosylase-like protein
MHYCYQHGGNMENKHESSAPPKSWKKCFDLRSRVKTIYKFAFGTLVVLSLVMGSQAFRATPDSTSASGYSARLGSSGASLRSPLNAEVFKKYVSVTSQRMYPKLSREIVDSAIKYSEKYGLSPILVLAITEAESEFYPFALSKRNAKGLMQIHLESNQQLLMQEGIIKDPAEIFDPERTIEAGSYLLRKFINESPDLDTALDKYLGADSAAYKAKIHQAMGKILLLGITEQLNDASQHKILPIVKVETATKHPK